LNGVAGTIIPSRDARHYGTKGGFMPVRTFTRSAGRYLAQHIDRLTDTLDSVSQRVRETVASIFGQSAAEIVRDAVHAVLAESAGRCTTHAHSRPYESSPTPFGSSLVRPNSIWDRPEDPYDHRYSELDDPLHEDDYSSHDYGNDTSERPVASSRWPQALLAGLQAVVWWLRRRTGGQAVLTALAIGLAASLVTFLGGPLAIAAMGLAGAVLSLAGLIDPLDAGVAGVRQHYSARN
jgi:hypothetical protein